MYCVFDKCIVFLISVLCLTCMGHRRCEEFSVTSRSKPYGDRAIMAPLWKLVKGGANVYGQMTYPCECA